jgi:hypothetical protein
MVEGTTVDGFTILLPMYDNSISSLKWTINVIGLMSVLINGMVFEVYGTGGVGMVWGCRLMYLMVL